MSAISRSGTAASVAAEVDRLDDALVLEHRQPLALVDAGEEVGREERHLDALPAVRPLPQRRPHRQEDLVAGRREARRDPLLGAGLV